MYNLDPKQLEKLSKGEVAIDYRMVKNLELLNHIAEICTKAPQYFKGIADYYYVEGNLMPSTHNLPVRLKVLPLLTVNDFLEGKSELELLKERVTALENKTTYIFVYKGNSYSVKGISKMKHPENGNWIESVIYESNGEIYVREKKDFDDKFTKVITSEIEALNINPIEYKLKSPSIEIDGLTKKSAMKN